jgi:hypothetical protein
MFIINLLRKMVYLTYYFELRKVIIFKNKFLGQECYILGDSAQVKYYDLTKFDDKPMFCFNVSYMLNEIKIRKNETFAMTIEPFYFINDLIKRLYSIAMRIDYPITMASITYKEASNRGIPFFISATNLMSLFRKSIYSIFLKLPSDRFTSEITKTDYKWNAGVFQSAIALAIYMGFKKVTVIGVSFHSNSVTNRWYHKGLGKSGLSETDRHFNPNHPASKRLRNYFMEAIKYIDIEIITPNEADISELFRSIDYKSYTGLELKYRENNEITEHSFLEVCNESEYARSIGDIF